MSVNDPRAADQRVADQLGELLRLVGHSDIEELEVEHAGARFVIRRDLGIPAPAQATPAVPAASAASAPSDSFVVTAPIVGIFRRATGGAEPAIDVGSALDVGQAVGAVEAMRMLSRVHTERSGIVQEILVRDGQPVEYGQPLVVLRAT